MLQLQCDLQVCDWRAFSTNCAYPWRVLETGLLLEDLRY